MPGLAPGYPRLDGAEAGKTWMARTKPGHYGKSNHFQTIADAHGGKAVKGTIKARVCA